MVTPALGPRVGSAVLGAARLPLFGGLLALTGAAHLESVLRPAVDGDEDGYSAIAMLMLGGGRLYADGGVDNKPPIIFWIYSGAFRLLGDTNILSVRVLKVAVVLATAVLVGMIAGRLAGENAGWMAAVLYGVFTAAGDVPQFAAANTEVFMMLPLAGSVLLLLDRRLFLAGLLIGVACMVKQVAVLNLLLGLAVALARPPRARQVGALAAGFGVGIGLLLAALGLSGDPAGFLRWSVISLFGYGPPLWKSGLALANLDRVLPWLAVTPLLWLPAGYRMASTRWPIMPAGERLAVGWLLPAAIGVAAGGQFFSHYFIQVVAPLAVLAGIGLAELLPRLGSRNRRRAAAIALAAAALLVPILPGLARLAEPPAAAPISPVAQYLRAHSDPNQRVFVWGDSPSLYVTSRRAPASRFVGFLRGFPRQLDWAPPSWDTTPDVWPLVARDFQQHPPAYIVDTSTDPRGSFAHYPISRFPKLLTLISIRYEKVALVNGVTVYALASESGGYAGAG